MVGKLTNRILRAFSSAPLLTEYNHLGTQVSPCLNLALHRYRHKRTGTRIFHFENSDPDRAFAAMVKTYPQNNKGCPHILEHLACCGSHRYPIRDPFFNMIKRSVSTYMNAWTGDDFTAYPFATPNPRDWDNLYRVYLDMSLRPLLNQLDFMQEGWRWEVSP
jgi:presequence protease